MMSGCSPLKGGGGGDGRDLHWVAAHSKSKGRPPRMNPQNTKLPWPLSLAPDTSSMRLKFLVRKEYGGICNRVILTDPSADSCQSLANREGRQYLPNGKTSCLPSEGLLLRSGEKKNETDPQRCSSAAGDSFEASR
ncbi:hypothetical protein NPIL_526021 [Nephila pilipes]|uniref:Uncharacterized protein n=1 Tax=Nephila pilipes TaxID=299642 RepID=A0A8X6Q089_NEPPI|nr:hypothetical protein NPIL_526021 [Nephila pilipes]